MAAPSWFERLIFGQSTRRWSDFAHKVTRYRYWPMPDAERADCWRARRLVVESRPMDWATMAGQTITQSDPGRVSPKGVGSGTPMQRGTIARRTVTYGVAEWGRQDIGTLPLPESGWYWLRGHPTPSYDRHCVVVAPNGDVHELIQFDPDAAQASPPWPNQALGWSRWRAGVLVEGDAVTATDLPLHAYVWTPWSHLEPHEQALVVADYSGADGLLTDGPVAGQRVCLDANSGSYRKMIAEGGDCASRANALVVHGARVIDRKGYADSDARTLGLKPYHPHLHTQAGAWPSRSNVGRFRISIDDLRAAS